MGVFTTRARYTGMSGVDTESMVQAMMKAESMRYDNLKKTRQRTIWKQEAYVAHRNAINAFYKSFIDISGANSLRKSGSFMSTTAKVTAGGAASNAVKVNASTQATGKFDLIVKQLAQNDVYKSASKVQGSIAGSEGFDANNLQKNDTFNVTLDGRTVQITIDDSFFDGDDIKTGQDFVDQLNVKLRAAFGTETVAGRTDPVTGDSNTALKVEARLGNNDSLIFETHGKHTITLKEGNGRTSVSDVGETNWPNSASVGNEYSFQIKVGSGAPQTITFTYQDNLQDVIDDINRKLSGKGVRVSFEPGDMDGEYKFKFTAIGTVSKIEVSDSGGGLGQLGFAAGTTIELEPTSVLTARMGIVNGSSNQYNTSKKLGELDPTAFSGADADGNIIFKINGQDFKVNENWTVKDFMTNLNNANLGVKMSYDYMTEKFTLEGTKTGTINAINLDDDTKAFFTDNFGFDFVVPASTPENPNPRAPSHTQTAQDSKFSVDGIEYIRETNDITLARTSGDDTLSFKLLEADENVTITLDIAKDTTKVFDLIKGFVDAYNALIEGVNGSVNQTRAKNGKHSYYEPLTDDQREVMKDSDIAAWDAKAKQGILYRDQTLAKFTTDLRYAMYESITLDSGRKISLYEIGITTSNKAADQGKLVIDEDKLREAIETRGEDIEKLFTKSETVVTDASGNPKFDPRTGKKMVEAGLAERLYTIIDKETLGSKGSLTAKVGDEFYATTLKNSEMNKLLEDHDEQLANMLLWLRDKEESYYLKFSRMEAAITQSSSQMSYLQSMMGM